MKIKNKNFAIAGLVIAAGGLLGLFQDAENVISRAFLFCVVGGILVFVSTKVRAPTPPAATAPVPAAKSKSANFEFPEFDEGGHKCLGLSHVLLSGMTHEHFGSHPQDIIPTVRKGQQVFLHPDPKNRHDKNAVYVTTASGAFLGWIPAGRNADLFKRLTEGQTVYACVESTETIFYDDDPDYNDEETLNAVLNAPMGCTVTIAKYSKTVPKG